MASAPCCIHTFPDSATFARQLSRALGTTTSRLALHSFPDGESLIRVRPPIGETAVLVRSLHDPNGKLLEVLLAADALRRAGAQRVILVAPYLPYMRQDTVFHPGEPISQLVIGSSLGRSFDGVLTLEAHLHRVQRLNEVIPCEAQSLSAAPLLVAWLRRAGAQYLVVGPDAESEPWVRAIAREGETPWIVGQKNRYGDRRVQIRFPEFSPCARAVIVDDIASSGATITAAAKILRRRGALIVDVAIIHAIFAPGAVTRIRSAGVRKILSCDTVPHPTNMLRSAPLFAAALQDMVS